MLNELRALIDLLIQLKRLSAHASVAAFVTGTVTRDFAIVSRSQSLSKTSGSKAIVLEEAISPKYVVDLVLHNRAYESRRSESGTESRDVTLLSLKRSQRMGWGQN